MIKYEDLLNLYMNAGENLRSFVIGFVLRRFDDYGCAEDCIREVLEHGCKSGIVSDLVYYSDTLAFFERFKEEIGQKLYEFMQDGDEYDMSQLFHDWDIEDPLALGLTNRNLLAWFGFEEAMYDLALELGVEI